MATAHAALDAQHRAWAEGDLSSLFSRAATDTNGLNVIDRQDIITLPWPGAVIDSAQSLLWGEVPGVTSDNSGMTAWLEQNAAELWQTLEQTTRDLAITGYGCLLIQGSSIRVVNSTFWQPVVAADDAGQRTGNLLAYPYHSPAAARDGGKPPDLLRVTALPLDGSPATVSTYALAEGKVGALLAQTEAADLKAIYAFGNGVSSLQGLGPALRELCVRYTAASRVMNRHTSPHMTGPPDSTLLTDAEAYKGTGMYLPRTDDQNDYAYLTWTSELTAVFSQIDRLNRQLALLSGPAALDLSGAGESGNARQALLWQSTARAARIRRDLENILLRAIPLAAEATGTLTIDWPDVSFAPWAERAASMATLTKEGVITAAEARAELGIRAI